jgi:DNA-binding transcriptional LysR family regulator
MIARKYLYLIALAKEKHFGRAAAACHVSISTLSAAIRDLEEELGVAVVERGQHAATLSPEGLRVLDHARRAADIAESLKQDLAQLRGGLTGRLRLGVIPTALTVIADLTTAFKRRHPLVTIELKSLATPDILERLRNFEIDAGLLYSESSGEHGIDFLPLWREDHVLITGKGGAFAGRTEVSWEEAAQLQLCLLTPDMQNRKIIDSVFASLGCAVTPQLEANSILSILAHICAGSWSSIVPRSVLDLIGAPDQVQVLELVPATVAWSTGLATLARQPLPPMVAAVIEVAKSIGISE